MKESVKISVEPIADKDPYQHYQVKRRLDTTNKVLTILAILIDIAILALSFFAIVIAISAHNKDTLCSLRDTQIYVYTMTAICLVRCLHLILMTLFMIFWVLILMPCLFCVPENCCAKRFLIKRAKAPKVVLAKLRAQWTWSFYPPEYSNTKYLDVDDAKVKTTLQSIKNCSICLLGYERGQLLTLLPC